MKRDHVARAVRQHLGPDALRHLPAGGLHLWVALPPGTSDSRVATEAAARDEALRVLAEVVAATTGN